MWLFDVSQTLFIGVLLLNQISSPFIQRSVQETLMVLYCDRFSQPLNIVVSIKMNEQTNVREIKNNSEQTQHHLYSKTNFKI